MQKGDKALTPQIMFVDTKANIEAYPNPQEGQYAQQTDSPYAMGRYANGAWTWVSGGGVGTGTAGRVIKWGPAGSTLVDAALIPPVSNVLTLTATAASTLALAITAGKMLTLTATDNFNLTIPATMTVAGRDVANTFTEILKITETTIAKANGLVINGAGGDLLAFHALDLGGITYSFYSTNRMFGGSLNWAALGYPARAAGSLQIENDILSFYQFAANSNTPNEKFFIASDGSLNVGSRGGAALFSVTALGEVVFAKNVWHTSKDGKYRLFFLNNSTTYFGSPAGYVFRNLGDTVDLLTITNLGITNFVATTTITNAPLIAFDLSAIVSTAATGFTTGGGVAFTLTGETATNGTSQIMAQIATIYIDSTNATRKSKLQLSAYDTSQRIGLEIEASGTAPKLGFFGGTTAVQQVLAAYSSDGEGSAYTGIDNAQAGMPYAQLTDLNQLRVAYETLRASYDDLRTKLQTSTLVG